MGRPTLSVVPRAIEYSWAPSVAQGLTPCVNTQVELSKKLIEFTEFKKDLVLPIERSENALPAMLDVIIRLLRNSNSVNSAK